MSEKLLTEHANLRVILESCRAHHSKVMLFHSRLPSNAATSWINRLRRSTTRFSSRCASFRSRRRRSLCANSRHGQAQGGVVVAAGPGKQHPETGKLMPCPVKEGELVLLSDFVGENVDYNGEKHIFVDADTCSGRTRTRR